MFQLGHNLVNKIKKGRTATTVTLNYKNNLQIAKWKKIYDLEKIGFYHQSRIIEFGIVRISPLSN